MDANKNRTLLSNIRRGQATEAEVKEAVKILRTTPAQDWDDFHVLLAGCLAATGR